VREKRRGRAVLPAFSLLDPISPDRSPAGFFDRGEGLPLAAVPAGEGLEAAPLPLADVLQVQLGARQRAGQPQRFPHPCHLAGRGRRWRLGGVGTATRSDIFRCSAASLKCLSPKLAAADVHGVRGMGHEVAHAPFREADLEAPFHYSRIGTEVIDQQKVLVSKLRIWAEPKVPSPGVPLPVKVMWGLQDWGYRGCCTASQARWYPVDLSLC
jgi:hypothetical protein